MPEIEAETARAVENDAAYASSRDHPAAELKRLDHLIACAMRELQGCQPLNPRAQLKRPIVSDEGVGHSSKHETD